MADLDPSTFQAVANANYKAMAEFPMHQQNHALVLQNQMLQNSVTHQKRIDGLSEVALSQVIKSLIEMDPEQASAQVKAFTGNDVSTQLGAMGAAVSAIQELVKTAQSTPVYVASGSGGAAVVSKVQ